jgi:hypothetical protein
MSIDAKNVALFPGMDVTVEIKTKQLRLIEYSLRWNGKKRAIRGIDSNSPLAGDAYSTSAAKGWTEGGY